MSEMTYVIYIAALGVMVVAIGLTVITLFGRRN